MKNFLFAAYVQINKGKYIPAIKDLCTVFDVKGKILPISLDNSELCVRLSDGSVLKGEGIIDTRSIKDSRTIVSAFLSPKARIYGGAREAIEKADKIVFCPGDLFTSIIPNTLVSGFKEAIKKSHAKLIYVVNLMTKKAETDGFTASKFSKTLLGYIGRKKFDVIVCNSSEIDSKIQESYKKQLSFPVKVDEKELQKFCDKIIIENLANQTGGIVRHSKKTASIIARI